MKLFGSFVLAFVLASLAFGGLDLAFGQDLEPPTDPIPGFSIDCPNGVDALTVENGYVTAATCTP